jgi:hypothetical protein
MVFPPSLCVRKSVNSSRGAVVADDRYDVMIIGTGAGGGTLAHRLAATGKRILLLERGGWLPASGTTGTRPRCSSRAGTARPSSGSIGTAASSRPR